MNRARCELGTDDEELALQAQNQVRKVCQPVVGELNSGRSEGGDRLVDRAVSLRSGIGFGNSAAVEQPGRSVVALTGGNRALGDRGPTTW
jgi:hypothetical protein